jgi:hypothetical protein
VVLALERLVDIGRELVALRRLPREAPREVVQVVRRDPLLARREVDAERQLLCFYPDEVTNPAATKCVNIRQPSCHADHHADEYEEGGAQNSCGGNGVFHGDLLIRNRGITLWNQNALKALWKQSDDHAIPCRAESYGRRTFSDGNNGGISSLSAICSALRAARLA